MSFLDRFKRKASEEKTPENAPQVNPESNAEPTTAHKPDPAVQLAAATVAAGYTPEFKASARKDAPGTPATISAPGLAAAVSPQHEIILELGDFLPRIPAHLLGEQNPDPAMPLSFEVGDLADRIARGQTTLPVAEIRRRAPAIFRGEILPSENVEVRFPWQKVMKMLLAHRNPQGGPAPAGLTAAAADSLAEKLRSRRAVRNIIPGSPADPHAQPPTTPQPQPQTIGPQPPPIAAPLPKPTDIPIPASNAEEDAKMTKEDAIKARDVMRGLVARLKGEYERQLAAAEQQRKALLEEREKVIVELIRTKKDSDDKNEQVEFEKSVATKSVDSLAKVQQERDALKLELSNLRVELGKAAQGNDQRVKDLIAERDALAQQQANLAKQISEFQKRGGKTSGVAGDVAAAAVGGAVAAAASQKQIEEFQRRITGLEAAQRDNAQELVREREAKTKIEHQLAAADRAHQETTAKLQDVKKTLQRDHENALRKREADSSRSINELQDMAAALQTANAKLTSDLDDARRKLASAEHHTGAGAAAMAQFESDIDSYRTRIKALLKEKETLKGEQQKLTAKITEQEKALADQGTQKEDSAKAEANQKQSQEQTAQLRAENEKLQAQLKSLQSEHESLGAKVAALQGVEVEHNKTKEDVSQSREQIEKLQAQLQTLAAEREDLTAKLKSLQTQAGAVPKITTRAQKLATENEHLTQELASVRSEHARALEQHQEELSNLKQQHASALAEKNTSLQQLNAAIPTQQSELAQQRTENQRLAKELATATAAVAAAAIAAKAHEALSAEHARVTNELETTRKSSDTTITGLQDLHKKALGERDVLTAEIEKVKAAQDQLATEKNSLKDELEKLRTSHAAASADSGATREAHEKALTELTADRDKLRDQLDMVTKELVAVRNQHQELNAGQENQSSARSALEKTLAEVTKNRDELLARIETMAGELATAKQEHGLAFAALDKDRDALRASKDALSAEFAATRSSYDKTLADVHGNFAKVEAVKAAIESQLTEARKQIEELQGKLKSAELALSDSRTELVARTEAAAKQLPEHQAAITALTGKHERALAALSAEKDAAVAKIAAEKAAIAAEVDDRIAKLQDTHTKAVNSLREEKSATIAALTEQTNATVAALTAERDKVRAALAEAERKYPAEIAALISARDSAQHDSASVAERLANMSVEAEQKHAQLTQERDAVRAEKEKIAAELDQARETHKAQAGVFASEFKTVVKQRDDALTQLDAERANLANKVNDFEKERAAFAAAENEAKMRSERDLTRLRRERDSIVQQRDALRERLEKLVEDQRQLLEEINTQAAFTAMKHDVATGTVTPESAAGESDIEVEAVPPPMPKAREKKKESNVIDITAAEIVTPVQDEEGRLKIPRVRPVVIPPPQLRVL